jgi:hypothetical protein
LSFQSRTTPHFAAVALLFFAASCNEDADSKNPDSTPASRSAELIFPESLRVDEPGVNQFVSTALAQCAGGEYDAFRSLWTAKQEPISRAEFNEGWDAVRRIEVRALEKALLDLGDGSGDPEPIYVLFAEVKLDAAARVGRREPVREIVLALVREHDQWRLAGAPKEMRDWVRKKHEVAGDPPTPEGSSTNAP